MDDIEFGNSITPLEFIDFRKSVNWPIPNVDRAKAGLKNSVLIVTAVYKNKTIGMCRIVGDHSFMFLVSDMMVLPEYQNRGVGNKIMARVVSYIKELPKGSSIGLMAAKGRESFYNKYGFIKRPNSFYGNGMTFNPDLLYKET